MCVGKELYLLLVSFRLIFKHRVITKAKLGRNVVFDMGKFKVKRISRFILVKVFLLTKVLKCALSVVI